MSKEAKLVLDLDLSKWTSSIQKAKMMLGTVGNQAKSMGGWKENKDANGKVTGYSPPGSSGQSPLSMLTTIASTLGLGLSIGGLLARQRSISASRLGISAFAGGTATSSMSQYGFSPQERRDRLMGITRAAGRNMGVGEQNQLANMGELGERAFGISSGEQAGLVGAGRKAGNDEGGRLFAKTIGQAVAAGLTGSRVGEYLQSMTAALARMSQGINIDTDSLNRFAGTLAALPFFKNDPERAMRAAQGISESFKNGNPYQKAFWAREIRSQIPSASAFEISNIMARGPFGRSESGSPVSGFDANKGIRHGIAQIMGRTKDPQRQIAELRRTLGLDEGAAESIQQDAARHGNQLSDAGIISVKQSLTGMQKRARGTFAGQDAAAAREGAKIEQAMDIMSRDLTKIFLGMANKFGTTAEGLAHFGESLMLADAGLVAFKAGLAVAANPEVAAGAVAVGGAAYLGLNAKNKMSKAKAAKMGAGFGGMSPDWRDKMLAHNHDQKIMQGMRDKKYDDLQSKNHEKTMHKEKEKSAQNADLPAVGGKIDTTNVLLSQISKKLSSPARRVPGSSDTAIGKGL